MRVLFVSPYPPERDGIGAYCSLLYRELVEQGHDVAVISARPSAAAPAEVIGSLPSPWRFSIERVVAAAVDFRPDVVHVQFAIAAYGTLLRSLLGLIDALRMLDLPVVITMHEITRDTQSLRTPGRALYGRVARRANQIIVHTESARLALARANVGPTPTVSVIAHPRAELPATGIDADDLRRRFCLGRDRVILSFGFIDVDKGLGDLIVAAGSLKDAGALDAVKIVVAGAVRRRFGAFRIFELRDRLHLRAVRKLVSDHELEKQVLFTGFVPTEEVHAWFETAAVAVLPYRRSEQSGVASLAAAAGTPLLTSSVGELPALSALPSVPPSDPDALAACLGEFLSATADEPLLVASRSDLSDIVTQMCELYGAIAPHVQLPSLAP